ncbi:MAG: phosphotransferase [SAR324 cluster bacterium]|nr:phosphotransferase [SAR324 cluster bacterium]
MNEHFQSVIRRSTGAKEFFEVGVIQSLWSGYGKIVRYGLKGSSMKSVVVKHVRLPEQNQHPLGLDTDRSHQRKIRSYHIEMAWYFQWSNRCDEACYVPKCLALESQGDEFLMVLEDLDAAGYPKRRSYVSKSEIRACLVWLANFHAVFMGEDPKGLWKQGTYWHLETRPDELRALSDRALKNAAVSIDQKLQETPYQTFIHGDAKLANFCFSQDGKRVAAVDFQYVGGGCGMKDVAYFIGSCLDDAECERQESLLLDFYFHSLKSALASKGITIDADALEYDWRALYPVAWTDFHRFLKGWSPGFWRGHRYSERLAREVIAELGD